MSRIQETLSVHTEDTQHRAIRSVNKATVSTSLESIRRLAVTKQRLAGRLPSRATREHILSVVRDLCYVQWDPIEAVAPSHIIALWGRIGNFRLSDLDALLWEGKKLFLHQTPSIVLRAENHHAF